MRARTLQSKPPEKRTARGEPPSSLDGLCGRSRSLSEMDSRSKASRDCTDGDWISRGAPTMSMVLFNEKIRSAYL